MGNEPLSGSSIDPVGDELEHHFQQHAHENESSLQLLRRTYMGLVQRILNPPRRAYPSSALGPDRFKWSGDNEWWCKEEFTAYSHTDNNEESIPLACAMWQPCGSDPSIPPLIPTHVVIYIHAAACAMDDAIEALQVCVRLRLPLLAFDSRCCGRSGGRHITVAMYKDVDAVLDHVTMRFPSCQVVLWGRAAGAVAALQFLHEAGPLPRTMICGLVLDTPFGSVQRLIDDAMAKLQSQGYWVPKPLFDMGCACVRMSIKARTSTREDPFSLTPLAYARTCTAPCLVGVSTGDQYIDPRQTRDVVASLVSASVVEVHEFCTQYMESRPRSFLSAVASYIACICGTGPPQTDPVEGLSLEQFCGEGFERGQYGIPERLHPPWISD